MSKALGSLERTRGLEPVLLESLGFGAERPLAGFEDGANYAENRRVELRIITVEDDKYDKALGDDARPPCARLCTCWGRRR